jgi:hypothetical protein
MKMKISKKDCKLYRKNKEYIALLGDKKKNASDMFGKLEKKLKGTNNILV